MKNSKFDKFESEKLVNQNAILGGNKSDVNYNDSTFGNHYDIAVLSLVDNINSGAALDKPDTKVVTP